MIQVMSIWLKKIKIVGFRQKLWSLVVKWFIIKLLGSDFESYTFSQYSQIFSHKRNYTLGFLAEISFTPLLYHPVGCLGCPEKWTSSRNYNLFVWCAVFQPKWNAIQKSYKNYQNPLKSYCFSGCFQSLFNFG